MTEARVLPNNGPLGMRSVFPDDERVQFEWIAGKEGKEFFVFTDEWSKTYRVTGYGTFVEISYTPEDE